MLGSAVDRRFRQAAAILLTAIAGSGCNGCRSTEMERRVAEFNKCAALAESYFASGDLNRAEEMYRKCLKFNEQDGFKGGAAFDYYSIGKIYVARGDKDGARKYFTHARLLYEEIGSRNCAAKVKDAIKELDQPDKP